MENEDMLLLNTKPKYSKTHRDKIPDEIKNLNSARVPDTVGVLSVDPSSSSSSAFTPDPALASEPATSPAAFSPCGKWLALPAPDGVRIYDLGSYDEASAAAPPRLSRFLAVEGGVSAARFSPGSTFLSTYTKPPSKSAAVNAAAGAGGGGAPALGRNLALWRVSDGARVLSFACKGAQPPRTAAAWPLAVVGERDERAYHMVTNAVNVYDLGGARTAAEAAGGGGGGGGGGGIPASLPVFRKLPLKGVAAFAAVAPRSPSPSESSESAPASSSSPSSPSSHLLAAAVPEAKGAPGLVGIWQVDLLPLGGGAASAAASSGGDGAAAAAAAAAPAAEGGQPQPSQQRVDPPAPVAKRSLMRASAVDLRWSPTGEALLALASAEPDAANKSYYGDSKLHYLRSDGSKDCLVPLPKEGPVHDVAWSPRGDCFVALAGFMPPRAVVFDARCAPSLDLGSGPFCHARWSPHHGRFLVLAGFGNLAGDLAFYARKADGKLKPCGSARAAGGVSLEWSPDSRLLLVSTTAPRLRVDNGVRVFSWDGALVASRPWEVLLEAAWRPAGKGVFPDRPPSPRVAAGAGAASAPSSSASASSAASAPAAARPAAAAAPVRPTAFVPPHLRGRGAPPPRAAKLSLGADDDGDGGGVVVGAAPRKITGDSFDMASVKACFSKTRLPPGAEAILESGGSNKAAAKNAKRRAAAAAKKKAAEEGGG